MMTKTTLFLLLLLSQFALAKISNDSIWPHCARKMADRPFYGCAMPFVDDFDCDSCGCSANGGSMGFSSVFNNNFVGIRYFYQSYTSRNGIFANSPWIDEDFHTVQVWARVPITPKVQLSTLLPFHYHTRERDTAEETIRGMGDVTILALYNVYETSKDSTVFTHKVQVGAGLKAPTGKFDAQNNKGSVNPGFQVGTGSWDYLLAAEYVVKKAKLGLSLMGNYTFKTENEKLYRFGNQFNYGSTLFYLIETAAVKWVPQVGVAGEVYDSNRQYRQLVPDSAGDVVFGKFALEAGRNAFSVGINTMLPINQNLSNGKVRSNCRWSINLNYSL